MSSKSPIFSMQQPHHFSDYGFDPQIDYFQVLEEARKLKRESTRSIDSIHFKLSKPISKDEYTKKSQKGNSNAKKKRWWRSALFFFKWKWARDSHYNTQNINGFSEDVHRARARAFRASISGPVYITESRSGPATPRRSSGRYSPGSHTGTPSPLDNDDDVAGIPYVSLRQLNMEHQRRVSTSSSAMPIYLVT